MSAARIGLLFGSFNPVHTGHLILAEYFATRTDLAEVWLVVSPHSPFKATADLLPDAERLRLVRLALAGNPRLRAEDIEFGLLRPSYTIATLDALRQRHPSHDFVLLMGADNVPGLPRWQESARLLAEFDIYVYPRPGAVLPGVLVGQGLQRGPIQIRVLSRNVADRPLRRPRPLDRRYPWDSNFKSTLNKSPQFWGL